MTSQRPLVVVDLSAGPCRETAEALLSAAEHEGFFFLVGHGIPQQEIDAAFALSRRFFAAPDDVKRATRGDTSNAHYVLGYTEELLAEGTTARQGFLCAYDNSRMSKLFPSEEHLPDFKKQCLHFMRLLDGVVVKLMQCFALALDLPSDHFTREMSPDDDDNGTALFFNRYPSVEGKTFPADALRIHEHTDFEVITLLLQNAPGLEICPGKDVATPHGALDDSKWCPVDPMPGAITCNLGDALQYWTDGRVKSTYHRVRLPRPDEFQGDRYSLAYFANAGLHTPLQGPSKKYPPVTFLDLLEARRLRVPMAMDPTTGTVGPDALREYQSFVAGPEVSEADALSAVLAQSTVSHPLARIDLSDFDNRKCEIAASLLAAAENEGFFYLVNHGIPQDAVDAAFALSRRFFAAPDDVKHATRGDNSNAHYVLGYSTEELAEGTMRQGMLCAYDNSRMAPLWPSEEQLPHFKEDCLRFMRMLDGVVFKLMQCFALALELPDDHFTKEMSPDDDDNGTALFFNRYPSVEGRTLKADAMRIWPHTDFEVLTLLFQTRPGLEMCPGLKAASAADALDNSKWFSVDPVPGAITVNLGDALQYWTDGRIKSTYHRVRVPRPDEYQGDRYSLAYFSNAGLHTPLQGPSKKYPPVTFLDILAKRAATVPLVSDPETGKVRVETLMGAAGGPDFA